MRQAAPSDIFFPRLRRATQRVASALGTAAVLGFGALVAAPAQALEPLNIGTVIWIGYGPFFVADALGLWKKNGLTVRLRVFSDPALIPPAIAGDAVDGGIITYDQVIGQDGKGQHQAVVLPVDYSDGGDAIVVDNSVHAVSELKGTKVAFNTLSPSDFLLSYALSTVGLTEKDIVTAEMTPETIPTALIGGRIKAGVTYEPFVSQITKQGGGKQFKVLYSSHDALGLIADVLVFDRKQIARHPAEIRALMQGYFDGLEFMHKNPDKAAELISKAMGISPAEVKQQLRGIHNPSLPEMLVNLERSKSPASFSNSGAVISKILKTKKQIDVAPAFEETVDADFLKAMAAAPAAH